MEETSNTVPTTQEKERWAVAASHIGSTRHIKVSTMAQPPHIGINTSDAQEGEGQGVAGGGADKIRS